MIQLADEVVDLIDGGCRKLVFTLGPESLQCLYSVFLAKLVMFQRVLRERGGGTPPTSAYQLVLGLSGHTERHTAQLLEVKASPGYPKN